MFGRFKIKRVSSREDSMLLRRKSTVSDNGEVRVMFTLT